MPLATRMGPSVAVLSPNSCARVSSKARNLASRRFVTRRGVACWARDGAQKSQEDVPTVDVPTVELDVEIERGAGARWESR